MTPCSFLSTTDNDVECFCDCAFYNYEDNEGACPFKNLTGNRLGKIKDLLKFDFFSEENTSEDDSDFDDIHHFYKDKEFSS